MGGSDTFCFLSPCHVPSPVPSPHNSPERMMPMFQLSTQTQRGEVSCLRTHSKSVAEPEMDRRSGGPWT